MLIGRNRSSPVPNETDRVRKIFDAQAPKYDRSMARFERLLFAGNREWVCSRATGDALEIAVGTGLNLSYYPPGVRLTGIEISSEMAELGRGRAAELGVEAEMLVGDAQALELADESFDAVVCTYGLCTIPDYFAAVAEAHRVLRPGGRFLLAEHVRSSNPVVRAFQHLGEPIAHRFDGDHLLREPLRALADAGFEVEEYERLKAGIVELTAARRPQEAGRATV
jgi:ubiquinone/menaquinone biosynthesis C-methylase UbiE